MTTLRAYLEDYVTRAATQDKQLATWINGNLADLSTLDTTANSSLVAAINEIVADIDALSSGAIGALDDLTDVVIGSHAAGRILRADGTNFVDVAGATYFETAGAAAAAQAASQPVSAELTAIALLTGTTYGRAFLTLANQAGLVALIPGASDTVAGLVELATIAEGLTGTDNVRAVTSAVLQAKIDALVGGAPGILDTLKEIADRIALDETDFGSLVTTVAGKQAGDPTLTALAGVTTTANKVIYATASDTFATTDFTALGRSVVGAADANAAGIVLNLGDLSTMDLVATFEAALV